MPNWTPSEGWNLISDSFNHISMPPRDGPVLYMRRGWDEPVLMCFCDMNPMMNVFELYWREP